MASPYNLAQKKVNIALAEKMMQHFSPSVTKEGKQIMITDKGGHVRPLPPFHIDPQHVKKICKLNTKECQILGIFPTDLNSTLAELMQNKMRKGFRELGMNLKQKAAKMKERKNQRIARRAARGS